MKPFEWTPKQREALRLAAGPSSHIMLFGGSRSGKTFVHVRNTIMRALKAPHSRHAVLRFRFNHVKSSIIHDTFPKVMDLCFPGVKYKLDKTDWFAQFDNGAQVWFGGLDDKERTEKILGQEYSTILFNECSQIPYSSLQIAITRLAQKVDQEIEGRDPKPLPLRAYYDCNPPSKAHWSYQLFILKKDPTTKQNRGDGQHYVSLQMNPGDNLENLPPDYINTLENLSPRLKKRFLKGEFADATPNQLFLEETIEKWRKLDGSLPDFVRVVVGVDPSGSGDVDNADNDAIGITVGGLGTDGNAYLLEDCTVKAGPKTWGRVATDAWQRHSGDVIVGEVNYGGAMVKQTIQVANSRVPFKSVTASRGKVVRAEPFSALYEDGKIRHVGYFSELEDEMTAFSTVGYLGAESPNRADSWFWVLSELFPGMVKQKPKAQNHHVPQVSGWMGL